MLVTKGCVCVVLYYNKKSAGLYDIVLYYLAQYYPASYTSFVPFCVFFGKQ